MAQPPRLHPSAQQLRPPYHNHVTRQQQDTRLCNGNTCNGNGTSGAPCKSRRAEKTPVTRALNHVDFWPKCLTPALRACDATFETFKLIVARANRWLAEFSCYGLVSCETVDKKVIYVRDIYSGSMHFVDEDGPILASQIKGLRLWYRPRPGVAIPTPQPTPKQSPYPTPRSSPTPPLTSNGSYHCPCGTPHSPIITYQHPTRHHSSTANKFHISPLISTQKCKPASISSRLHVNPVTPLPADPKPRPPVFPMSTPQHSQQQPLARVHSLPHSATSSNNRLPPTPLPSRTPSPSPSPRTSESPTPFPPPPLSSPKKTPPPPEPSTDSPPPPGKLTEHTLGFCDITPKYLNPGHKHPKFETLPQVIERINNRLASHPLPGKIISVETVTLKIAREDWSRDIPKVGPEQCHWFDQYNSHQLYFLRIFHLGCEPCPKQRIGLRDFRPDVMDEGGLFHAARYSQFASLVRKANLWLQRMPGILVTNIQTLDMKHRKKSENHGLRFNTDKMFEFKVEKRFRAYFLRVGYVHYVDQENIHQVALKLPMIPYQPPQPVPVITCRSYFPAKKTSGYENITETLQRVDKEIQQTGARVLHVQTVQLPEWLTKPELCEMGERTFFDGEWYFVPDQDGNDRGPYRYSLVYAFRVHYYDMPGEEEKFRNPPQSDEDKICCIVL